MSFVEFEEVSFGIKLKMRIGNYDWLIGLYVSQHQCKLELLIHTIKTNKFCFLLLYIDELFVIDLLYVFEFVFVFFECNETSDVVNLSFSR